MAEDDEVLKEEDNDADPDSEDVDGVDDPEAIAAEDLDDFEEDAFEDDEAVADADADEEDDDDEDDEKAAPKAKSDDDDDDDEPDPDDIEEDLDAILKDRLSAGDDEDEEDEEDEAGQVVKKPDPAVQGDVAPKQEGEWTCMNCFLIVTKAAASASTCPHCGAQRE